MHSESKSRASVRSFGAVHALAERVAADSEPMVDWSSGMVKI